MADSYPWRQSVQETLEHLARLEPGWDSYGAEPISAAAINACKEFLGVLSVMAAAIPEIPMPSIVPTCTGGVELEWNLSFKIWANVEFSRDGVVEAFSTTADNVEHEYGSERPGA